MSSLGEFLTSTEIIIVYIVAGLSCLVCFIIYLVEKNKEKLRQHHNTKQLNKLVEEIKVQYPEKEEVKVYKEPVLKVVNESQSEIERMLENTGKLKPVVDGETSREPMVIEPKKISNSISELQYTSIEPDQETAKLELKKIEEELLKTEELNKMKQDSIEPVVNYDEPVIENIEPIIDDKVVEQPIVKEVDNESKENTVKNIELTHYEKEQEASAIISLDELVKKGRELYEANEVNQYADEGNEPISLIDLENQMNKKVSNIEEKFAIEKMIPKKDMDEIEVLNIEEDSNNVTESNENKKFQSSPIISPIFGIERINNSEVNDIELENTANYEKLDQEIQKTNEFIMSLKELQEKLD